jgi:hypothetical protein
MHSYKKWPGLSSKKPKSSVSLKKEILAMQSPAIAGEIHRVRSGGQSRKREDFTML